MEGNCILDPTRDCLGLIKAVALEKRFDEQCQLCREERNKIGEKISELEKASIVRDQQYLSILEKLNDMSIKISEATAMTVELKEKPGKRWESVVDKVIMTIVGAAVGFFITQFGL